MSVYVERECRKGVERGGRDEVKSWTLECREELSKGVDIQDGLSCDRCGAQRRLSCTMTVSYNAEYIVYREWM